MANILEKVISNLDMLFVWAFWTNDQNFREQNLVLVYTCHKIADFRILSHYNKHEVFSYLLALSRNDTLFLTNMSKSERVRHHKR